MNFVEDVKETRRKAEGIVNKLVQLAKKIYGIKGTFIRTIIEGVVKPDVLYVWKSE